MGAVEDCGLDIERVSREKRTFLARTGLIIMLKKERELARIVTFTT